jgi:hypothetical protein
VMLGVYRGLLDELLARGWRNLDAWAGADRIRRGRVVFFGDHGQIAAHGAGPESPAGARSGSWCVTGWRGVDGRAPGDRDRNATL